jgi:oligoribonuclease
MDIDSMDLAKEFVMAISTDHLAWLDLEMTGLDPNRDTILELAMVITTKDLEIVAQGPELVVHQEEPVLLAMDQWNTSQHGRSGLIDAVRQSDLTIEQAEQQALDFLADWVPPNTSPMCGNCICQDRRFLHRLMPTLETFFHYRNLDVSTIKELAKYWAPDLARGLKKEARHRALSDILESVEELRYYRPYLFSAVLEE